MSEEVRGFMDEVPELTEEQMKSLAKKMKVDSFETEDKNAEQKIVEDSEFKPELDEKFGIYHAAQVEDYAEEYINNQEIDESKDVYTIGISSHQNRLLKELKFDLEHAQMQVEEYHSRGLEIPMWLIRKIKTLEVRAGEL